MTSGKSLRIIVLETLGPVVQKMRYLGLRLKGYDNISGLATIERNVNLDLAYPAFSSVPAA